MKWFLLLSLCMAYFSLNAEPATETETTEDSVVADESSPGSLVFETLTIDGGIAHSKDKEFVAKFPFTNKGTETVTILQAKASCGCTVPTLTKTEYAPGESGEINATFSFGARTGLQQKTISVVTDGDPPQRTTLQLKVTIPQIIELSPRVLFWDIKQEQEFEPKTFQVTLGKQVKGTVRLAGQEPEGFIVTMEPDETNPSKFTFKAQPLSRDRGRGKFKVEVVDADGTVLGDSYAFVIVR